MTIQREDLHGYVVVHLHTNQKRLRKEKTKRERTICVVPSFSMGSGTFCGAALYYKSNYSYLIYFKIFILY